MASDIVRWEYDAGELLYAYTTEDLNALGKDGWELVTFTAVPWTYEGRKGPEPGTTYNYVFKRPLLPLH